MTRQRLLDLAALIFLACCAAWLLFSSPGGVQ
jgi:hypothetical protein